MSESDCYLAFSLAPGIGPKRLSSLLVVTENAQNAWMANLNIFKLAGIGEKIYFRFEDFRNKFNVEEYKLKLEKNHVSFVAINNKDYPKLLKQIPDPPTLLFMRGNSSLLSSQVKNEKDKKISTLAVVGTRKTSSYGREVTQKIVSELTEFGITIVSGLALGIDAIAHKTTIDLNGATIAVLGCGIDCCYPQENLRLYDEIISKSGLIVSEYPLLAKSNKGTFPARNRIIAGLARAVLVTEAARDSGSLITAAMATKYNRPVFAIPGPITSVGAKGTNFLLKNGATLVTSAQEIIEKLEISKTVNTKRLLEHKLTNEEINILKLLSQQSSSIDEIANDLKMPIYKLIAILSSLEIKKMIVNIGNQEYRLA